MKRKLDILFFSMVLLGMQLVSYGQNLPCPDDDCGDAPPVGLPLPIDDYLPILVIVALCIGIYFFSRLENKVTTNS